MARLARSGTAKYLRTADSNGQQAHHIDNNTPYEYATHPPKNQPTRFRVSYYCSRVHLVGLISSSHVSFLRVLYQFTPYHTYVFSCFCLSVPSIRRLFSGKAPLANDHTVSNSFETRDVNVANEAPARLLARGPGLPGSLPQRR